VKHHWYCGVEGQQYGPFTWEQLRAMAAEGRVVGDSFVRREVDQQWFQAAQIPGLLPKAHPGAKKNGASSAIGKAASGRASDSSVVAAVGKEASKSSSSIKRAKSTAAHPSGNVPVGQPIAATTVGASAAPASASAGPPAAPAFAISVAPQPAAAKPGEQPEPAEKGMSPLLLVGILGGAVALVAVIGVGIVVWSLTRPAQTAQEQLASAMEREMQDALEEVAKDLQANPPSELSPQALTPDLAPIAGQLQKAVSENAGSLPAGSAPAASASPASAAEAAKVLKSVTRWTDASQLRGIELNKLKLSVGSVWLASDEAGTKTQPTAGSAKYVFVQVQLRNIAPVARKYKSWNATAGASVVLADQNDAVLSLVPTSATPAAGRLAAVDLQPGESVTDTLVFTAPSGAVEKLKLALAKSALAENARFRTGSHIALEIPLEFLLAGGPSSGGALSGEVPFAARRANLAPPGEQPAEPIPPLGIGDEPAPAKPVATPAPMPAEKKWDRPPSKEELNKQFEELSKKEGKAEAPKPEAPKSEEKAEEAPMPEPAKPDAPKPDAPNPQPSKPEPPQDKPPQDKAPE
jgi:hypothetical protein